MILVMNKWYIVGFMAVGKTTLGQMLAERLQQPFYDTDRLLEQQLALPLGEYIQQQGLSSFRQKEKACLQQTVYLAQGIIATGGGIIEETVNRQFLQEQAVLYIKQDFASLYTRLQTCDSTTRPLLKKSKQELEQLYRQRLPHYEQVATVTLDVSNCSLTEAVAQSLELIEKGENEFENCNCNR